MSTGTLVCSALQRMRRKLLPKTINKPKTTIFASNRGAPHSTSETCACTRAQMLPPRKKRAASVAAAPPVESSAAPPPKSPKRPRADSEHDQRRIKARCLKKCHHTNDKGEFDCNKSGTNFFLRSDDGKALPGATANRMCGKHRLPGQRHHTNMITNRKIVENPGPRGSIDKSKQCRHFFPNGDQCKLSGTQGRSRDIFDELKRKNSHVRDARIIFRAEGHAYFIDGRTNKFG